MNRAVIAGACVFIQVAILAGWAWREEARLATDEQGLATVGQSILVRTRPVDPRDFLRGQYMTLGYEFSSVSWLPGWEPTLPGKMTSGWVVLSPDGEFHAPVRVTPNRPRQLAGGEVAIRGAGGRGQWRFGVEKYFVPEGTPTPRPRDITVRLRVGTDGRPRIEEVYVKGVPWPAEN